jgi:protein TonB
MRTFRNDPDQGRLALALLLALGLHGVLLFGVSTDGQQSFQQPAPPQFEMQLVRSEPALIAPLAEPVLMEWLPPASLKSDLPETTVLESAPAPKSPSEPVVTPAPKPSPKPIAKPAPKSPQVAQSIPKPIPKPPIQPRPKPVSRPPPRLDIPPSKPVAPLAKPTTQPVTRRSESSERRRDSAGIAPARGKLDSAALIGQIASLETEQQTRQSAGVRTQRVSLTDTRSAAGFYAADWARKVTRVGEMNFPDIARRLNTSAGPLLEVAIHADGRLQDVRVIRSSGTVELDQAAQRIVKLAAPYPPFPPELRQDVDLLRIETPWRFDPGGRIRAR